MKMLDLFSGIGGISLAADWAGIETVAFCEIEPFCQKVLNKHWSDVPIFGDVRKLTKESLQEGGIDIGTIELISAGYPCQPFSLAGKREGENDDRHLWPEVNRLLKEIRPSWFIGENVAGHVTLGLDQVLSDLENLNYSCQPFIIPAAAVNAIHRRDRVFIVANSYSFRDYTTEEYRSIGNREKKMQKWSNAQHRPTDNINVNGNAYSKSELQANKEIITIGIKRGTRNCSAGFDRTILSGEYWETNKPPICGVDDGIPHRVDRLKSLGNAVVPQQIYPILKAIVDIEKGCSHGN